MVNKEAIKELMMSENEDDFLLAMNILQAAKIIFQPEELNSYTIYPVAGKEYGWLFYRTELYRYTRTKVPIPHAYRRKKEELLRKRHEMNWWERKLNDLFK